MYVKCLKNTVENIGTKSDIIAIKLIHEIKNRDPEYLKNHYIVGFMNSILAKLYSTTITSFAYDTNDLVQAIYVIYKTLLLLFDVLHLPLKVQYYYNSLLYLHHIFRTKNLRKI